MTLGLSVKGLLIHSSLFISDYLCVRICYVRICYVRICENLFALFVICL